MYNRRIALHRYDPKDLQQSFAKAQEEVAIERQKDGESQDNATLSVKEKELCNSGLLNLVEVTNSDNAFSQCSSGTADDIRSASYASNGSYLMSELDRWEATRQGDDELVISGGEDESDDDLL